MRMKGHSHMTWTPSSFPLAWAQLWHFSVGNGTQYQSLDTFLVSVFNGWRHLSRFAYYFEVLWSSEAQTVLFVRVVFSSLSANTTLMTVCSQRLILTCQILTLRPPFHFHLPLSQWKFWFYKLGMNPFHDDLRSKGKKLLTWKIFSIYVYSVFFLQLYKCCLWLVLFDVCLVIHVLFGL